MIRKETPCARVAAAEARVLEAARKLGATYEDGRDPTWNETNEIEQAAILLVRADRAKES